MIKDRNDTPCCWIIVTVIRILTKIETKCRHIHFQELDFIISKELLTRCQLFHWSCQGWRKLISLRAHPCTYLKSGHNQSASETPFEWRFAGGPIVAQDLCWLGSGSVVESYTRDRRVAGSSLSFMSFKSKMFYRLHCTGLTQGNVMKIVDWDVNHQHEHKSTCMYRYTTTSESFYIKMLMRSVQNEPVGLQYMTVSKCKVNARNPFF